MSDLSFDGKDPILVIDFLYSFVTEAHMLCMSETQAFVVLPHYLSVFALQQYQLVSGSLTVNDDIVAYWSEALQYLLRSYTTSNATLEAILTMRHVDKKPGKNKAV